MDLMHEVPFITQPWHGFSHGGNLNCVTVESISLTPHQWLGILCFPKTILKKANPSSDGLDCIDVRPCSML